MIIYTALTSYPPYVPGKRPVDLFNATELALRKIEEELYSLNPDTVIIIGKNDEAIYDTYLLGAHDQFITSFELYGDFEVTLKTKGDLYLAQMIKEGLSFHHPLSLSSEQKVSFGISYAIHQLLSRLKKTAILPLYISTQSLADHYEFGRKMREYCEESEKRIAIIAVGNMSHCLTQESPFKQHPVGKKFDERIIHALERQDTKSITTLDLTTLMKAKECVSPQLSMLLGSMEEQSYETNILSYEHPHGVGYLTVTFSPLRHGT